MAESKKVLVAFNPQEPQIQSSDFLVVIRNDDGAVEFLGTRSGITMPYGMVVLTSRPVTENDLFARLVDTGRRIPNVGETLTLLESFVDAMKTVKIGNVVEIATDGDGVVLSVAARSPSQFSE